MMPQDSEVHHGKTTNGNTEMLTVNKPAVKNELEVQKLRLENEKALLEIKSFGRPTKWEIIKSLAVIIPAIIMIFTFLYQRQAEIAQRQAALRMERIREIERARQTMEKGDRSAGIFQLALLGEEAIPHLLGQVNFNHNYLNNYGTSPSMAALLSLKQIGLEKLTTAHKEFLRNLVVDALLSNELILSEVSKDKPLDYKQYEAISGSLRIIEEILTIIPSASSKWEAQIGEIKHDLEMKKEIKASGDQIYQKKEPVNK